MTINNTANQDTVQLSCVLDAPIERVWHALTDEAELAAWYWPQRLDPEVTVDLRPGGRYRISSAPGEMAVSGEYLEITEPRRLVTRWQWDGEEAASQVTIDLVDDAGQTTLLVTHEGLDPEATAMHMQGWSDCLDRLPAQLA